MIRVSDTKIVAEWEKYRVHVEVQHGQGVSVLVKSEAAASSVQREECGLTIGRFRKSPAHDVVEGD